MRELLVSFNREEIEKAKRIFLAKVIKYQSFTFESDQEVTSYQAKNKLLRPWP